MAECQLSPCVDCGARLRQCALEVWLSQTHKIKPLLITYTIQYHMLNCEKRVTHRVFPCHPAPMVMHKRPTLCEFLNVDEQVVYYFLTNAISLCNKCIHTQF